MILTIDGILEKRIHMPLILGFSTNDLGSTTQDTLQRMCNSVT